VDEEQRQMEMDFAGRAELVIDNPAGDDVTLVEAALSDLDRLEGEMSGVAVSTEDVSERLRAR